MHVTNRLLTLFLSILPAALYCALVIAGFQGAYYSPVYNTSAAAFWAASLLGALILSWLFLAGSPASPPRRHRLRHGLVVFGSVLLGWAAALFTVALLNVTPLCIGHSNGDGINDLNLCLFYTALVAVIFTIPVVLAAAISGGLRSLLVRP